MLGTSIFSLSDNVFKRFPLRVVKSWYCGKELNIISIKSRQQLTLFMSFLGFTNSEVSCPRTIPEKKNRGSSVARTQDHWIMSQTLYHTATQEPSPHPLFQYTCRNLQTANSTFYKPKTCPCTTCSLTCVKTFYKINPLLTEHD